MIRRNWYIVDAKNKVLGRLSSMIVRYLNGKHKIEYAPHIDIGDYVVVVNSKRVYVSGQKRDNKIYYCHTGYVGGIKKFSFRQIIERYPERVVEFAVKGMLPKNSLGRIMYRRLKVYPGAQHDHVAQNLQVLSDEVKIG